MKTLNRIGLDTQASETVAEKLNVLLANYQVFYMNARSFHWNIKGSDFFELHQKFEEIYTDALIKIDELAERVLTLGFTPTHTFSDYTQTASIPEARNISDGKEAIRLILEGYETLLPIERSLLDNSEQANDEGTNALISDYIREQEKQIWMYSAYLG